MQKLSVLIFCRDNPQKVISLVKDVVSICDQIVLMDSSDNENFKSLKKLINTFPKGKVDIHRTLALGYPDPLREYGLEKCRYSWVLYLDTDERINLELKKDIRKIINNLKCDAFAIKRYENAHLNGENDGFFTWQVRLYNKNKIQYRGLVHEQPIVKGKLRKLDEKYCMLHVVELKTKGSKRRDLEYSLIKKYYDRLSYAMLNERMKEYMEKLVVPEDKKIEQTTIGKIVLGWMKFYQAVTLKNMHNEISTFDYFMFFSMIEGAYVMKRKDIKYLFGEAIPTVMKDTNSTSKFKKEKGGKEIFEISKEVNRHGIIRYLMLDKERVVDRLYEKYKDKPQGISLLMKLLEDRYKGDYP
jgi:hypothetical protein